VKVILSARRERRLSDLSTLGKLGILAQKASPFILLNGKRPEQQLMFAGW
jgi:predicted DNA-binding helix-hairpin-helix protein